MYLFIVYQDTFLQQWKVFYYKIFTVTSNSILNSFHRIKFQPEKNYVLHYHLSQKKSFKGIQSLKLIFFLFILKVANIRCFILIAVEIFHYIICKQPRTNEIRRFLIFLYPLKNSMLTRTIFIYSVTYKVSLFGKAFAHVRKRHKYEDFV